MVLTIELYDQEGRLLTDENDCICNVEFANGQELVDGTVMNNGESIAKKGKCIFDQLNIRQVPDSSAKMGFKFTKLQLFGNKVEELETEIPFNIFARQCDEGESYGSALTCLPCNAGSKLYKPQDEPGSCEPCLETETCYGSNSTAPLPEYWRSSAVSENYIKCFNPDACLGGNDTTPMGTCAEGYDGVLCANCVGRYSRGDSFECNECSSPEVNIFFSCIKFIFCMAYIIILVRITVSGTSKRNPMVPVYLRIFLDHF